MRDIKRIDIVTDKLKELWQMFPDMRFWQLMQMIEVPADKVGTDPFFWEDDLWEQIFQETINKYKK